MSASAGTPVPPLAQRFLNRLDPCAEFFTFQTFDDSKTGREDLARVLHGPLAEKTRELTELNSKGAGIFVTINETDSRGRKKENVVRVRAVVADLDGAPLEMVLSFHLRPHLIVDTSPGKYQAWWLVTGLPLDQFGAVQKTIAARFASDPSVHDLPRVLRVPGFFHRKSEPSLVTIHSEQEIPPYSAQQILEAFPPAQSHPKQESAKRRNGTAGEPIPEGQRNVILTSLAGSMRQKGFSPEAIEAALLIENTAQCSPPLTEAEVRSIARSVSRYSTEGQQAGPDPNAVIPWNAAVPAAVFISADEAQPTCLEDRLLMKGAVTEIFSPRGLGKTNVVHEICVRLARGGKKVLLLDRDNPRREIRRRLKAWGADGLQTMKIMARDQVPPLTDTAAWAAFPIGEYDLVVVDSFDATAEGCGEQDSSKPSKAISKLLDVARAQDGPAVLILGNTIKSAEHSRGSGVIEDRADIVYEIRDATDLKPSGTKAWWEELPPAGAGAWAQRASRRKKREKYRLAFIPTKFRTGEEPDPFILEVNHHADPWTVRDVTAGVIQSGEDAIKNEAEEAAGKEQEAIKALQSLIGERGKAGTPVEKTEEAIPFIQKCGFSRDRAREIIEAQDGKSWTIKRSHGKGKPAILVGCGSPPGAEKEDTAANTAGKESPLNSHGSEEQMLAARSGQGPQALPFTKPAPDAENPYPSFLRRDHFQHPTGETEEVIEEEDL